MAEDERELLRILLEVAERDRPGGALLVLDLLTSRELIDQTLAIWPWTPERLQEAIDRVAYEAAQMIWSAADTRH